MEHFDFPASKMHCENLIAVCLKYENMTQFHSWAQIGFIAVALCINTNFVPTNGSMAEMKVNTFMKNQASASAPCRKHSHSRTMKNAGSVVLDTVKAVGTW